MLNIANQITLLRILLVAPLAYCLLHINDGGASSQYRYYAIGLFAFMAFSDFLDGFVARRLNQVSKLGTILDPLADKILLSFSCIILATQHSAIAGFKIPFWVVAIIFGKDIILTMGFFVFLLICGRVKVVPNFLGKSTTAVLLIMIGAVLVAPDVTAIFPSWSTIVKLLWAISAITAFFATLVYIHSGSRYIEELGRVKCVCQ